MAATPQALSAEQLRSALASMPGWRLDPASAPGTQALIRTLRFPDFPAVMAFMADCVEDIERLAHHPQWDNLYDRLTIRLMTHDAGNRITALDVELAKRMSWKASVLGASDA